MLRVGGGLALVVLALVAFAIGGSGNDDCNDDESTDDVGILSAAAKDDIPKNAAEMYYSAAKQQNIDVAFLASIGAQECNHGRCPTINAVNGSGCVGWMQLGVGGRCGHYWDRNKCDGNDDGKMDVLDPWDNICGAAKGLRKEKGAPPAGGSEAKYRQAACDYYGACSDGVANYADEVMTRAKAYGFKGGDKTTELVNVGDPDGTSAGQCEAPAADGVLADGTDGQVTYTPNANRPGVAVTEDMKTVMRKIAGYYGHPITVCTGTNHNRLSSSGNVSDHWDGNGVDICSSANSFPASGGGKGDLIAAAAFRVAGQSEPDAVASGKRGGLVNITHGDFRFQIIWKTQKGGNHNDHVHVGVQRTNEVQQAVVSPLAARSGA
ncbi:hypothetical protein PAI11_15780 [Patulibacter medicamentivorans]|uniref:Transglycosylase SLT domain-containing protein n=1 Tax=Patulibacter medicamentivorans TaxID=1097667 RepID=H0E452_9ACTN|nr:hypothetical protein PAI11_15780 [Patulibacter medicamentivorans]